MQDLTPEVLFDPTISDDEKQTIRDILRVEDEIVMLAVESASPLSNLPDGSGFYSAKLQSLVQLAVTGDTCERVNPDFSLTVFRRDMYVVQRDGMRRVIRVISDEEIDPLSLADDQLAKAGIVRSEWEQKQYAERKRHLFTSCEWHYAKKQWKFCQCLGQTNGEEIYSEWYDLCPYAVAAANLAPGDNYGRGIIELAFADLFTYNTLTGCVIDIAGMMSKLVPVIDPNSDIRPEDLTKPSGVPVYGRVVDGVVKDVAFLKVDKGGDIQVVLALMNAIEERLGRVLMLTPESVRNSERTTKYEVQNVTLASQAETLLPVFVPIADQLDGPQIRYLMHLAREEKLLKERPEAVRKKVRVHLLTGQAALASQQRAVSAAALVQEINSLGEPAQKYLDYGVLARSLVRLKRIDEPGLVKSEAQKNAEEQAAIQQALAAQAAQQAIQTTGAVVENAAAAQSKGATQ